jgi:hypothetical protein
VGRPSRDADFRRAEAPIFLWVVVQWLRSDFRRLPAVERGFSVDFSLVGRFGVFPVVALVISVVCVLAVL